MESEDARWQELLNIAYGNHTAPFFFLGYVRAHLADELVSRAIKEWREFEADLVDRQSERWAREAAAREEARDIE